VFDEERLMIGWIDTILQGLMLGGLYALFAMGLSLMFGVMRLVNIAHGDLILLCSFAGFAIVDGLGLSPLVAFALVIPSSFAVGYALQRGVLNFTLGRDILPPLLVTFGLSIVIQNALLEIFSADTRSIKSGGFESASIQIAEALALGWLPFVIFITAVLAAWGLQWLFGSTSIGRAFRATSDDREAAQLMGVNNGHVYALATGVALALVAIAGIFHGMRPTIAPTDGPALLLYAFEAVIIGGLGSFWGTFAGGLILGVAQSIGFRIDPGWGILVGHLAFLVVLLFRPTGLFAKTR
jgi:branched-chain amino acid transport system permease protein